MITKEILPIEEIELKTEVSQRNGAVKRLQNYLLKGGYTFITFPNVPPVTAKQRRTATNQFSKGWTIRGSVVRGGIKIGLGEHRMVQDPTDSGIVIYRNNNTYSKQSN